MFTDSVSLADRILAGALLGVPLLACLLAAPARGEPARPSTRETAACTRDPRCHRTFVVSHRAHGFGAPENSREAVRRAVEAGVPVIKIDLRASKDGELYLLHDGTLDRGTNLRGRIEGFTSAELGQARLSNGETLPRFRDVYEIARGRAVLTVGFKADAVEPVADWIHAHGSFDDLIFFVNTGEQMRAAARAKTRYPGMMVMVRLLDTRVTVESTRAVFGGLPEIFHTDRVGAGEVARLQGLGVKVFMNVVPWEGYLQPFKHLAVGFILRTKLDFVLTDEAPSMLQRVAGP